MINLKTFFALFLILFISNHCAEVPVTGRKQLSLISNDELIQASTAQYQEVLNQAKVSDNAEWTSWVKNSGNRIKKAVEEYFKERGQSELLDGYNWEFNLLDDNSVNAWAMPGGKVAFYTGIMPICQSELGVAVVMGHEVAHAVANHGRERVSQQMAAQTGLSIASILLGGAGASASGDLLLQAAGAGTSLGILKFSRENESEADHLGLIFMALAGYNPEAAPKFWERMSANSGGQSPPEFLSTHPSHSTRIEDLNNWIPEAKQYYRKSN
ncbi:MAG: M48 family metallopeptidase [Bacteroidota bacterium]